MELQFDPEILTWLSKWTGQFQWDEGNEQKNEKHGITSSQIESIFNAPIYVAGKITSIEESRWLLLGETNDKGWALIVTVRGQKLRIISCRRQRKEEIKFYEKSKKEQDADIE